MKNWPALLLLAPLALAGCVSSDERPAVPVERSEGVVLQYPPDAVWVETKLAILQIGSRQPEVNEGARTTRAYVGLGTVTAKVEPYDAAGTRTILRVVAQSGNVAAPETAEKVRTRIQQQLIARHGR